MLPAAVTPPNLPKAPLWLQLLGVGLLPILPQDYPRHSLPPQKVKGQPEAIAIFSLPELR